MEWDRTDGKNPWETVWGINNANPVFQECAIIRQFQKLGPEVYCWEIWCMRSMNQIAHGEASTLEQAKLDVEATLTPADLLPGTVNDDKINHYRNGL